MAAFAQRVFLKFWPVLPVVGFVMLDLGLVPAAVPNQGIAKIETNLVRPEAALVGAQRPRQRRDVNPASGRRGADAVYFWPAPLAFYRDPAFTAEPASEPAPTVVSDEAADAAHRSDRSPAVRMKGCDDLPKPSRRAERGGTMFACASTKTPDADFEWSDFASARSPVRRF